MYLRIRRLLLFISFFNAEILTKVITSCFVTPQPPSIRWTKTTQASKSTAHQDEKDIDVTSSSSNKENLSSSKTDVVFTNAVLNITYDGGHFTGWSSATTTSTNIDNENHNIDDDDHDNGIESTDDMDDSPPLWKSRKQRRRQKRHGQKGGKNAGKGFVRGVEGILQQNLAKIFGKVDPDRVCVEGCSRTDKGVHATSMIAQFYCLTPEAAGAVAAAASSSFSHDEKEGTLGEEHDDKKNITMIQQMQYSIPGKRMPHPTSATDDTYFLPIKLDLQNLQYRLNRMLPDDLRISNISPTPTKKIHLIQQQNNKEEKETKTILPFHPTLDSISKTYQYTFSVGSMHDPTQWRFLWHVPAKVNNNKSDDKAGEEDCQESFDLLLAQQACDMLVGHHNFAAFRGAPRGSDDKRRQQAESTNCTLSKLSLEKVLDTSNSFASAVTTATSTYRITVTGDRFLYKMVRFMVGALVAVGTHKLTLEDMEFALDNGSFNKQFVCAPPHGLTLRDVTYNDDIQFDWIY